MDRRQWRWRHLLLPFLHASCNIALYVSLFRHGSADAGREFSSPTVTSSALETPVGSPSLLITLIGPHRGMRRCESGIGWVPVPAWFQNTGIHFVLLYAGEARSGLHATTLTQQSFDFQTMGDAAASSSPRAPPGFLPVPGCQEPSFRIKGGSGCMSAWGS